MTLSHLTRRLFPPRPSWLSRAVSRPIAPQLLSVRGAPLPLPFATPAHEAAWGAFYRQTIETTPGAAPLLTAFSQATPALSPGLLGGVSGENAVEGLHHPPGYDRAYAVTHEGSTVVVKGGGIRHPTFLVQVMEGAMPVPQRTEYFSPLTVTASARDTEINGRPLIGGGRDRDFEREVRGTLELLRRAYEIDGQLGGIPLPLALHRLEEVPVHTPEGEWRRVPLADFLTSHEYLSAEQLMNVGKIAAQASRSAEEKEAVQKFQGALREGLTSFNQAVTPELRQTIGALFLRSVPAATYAHALHDTFRIGHLHAQLVTNEFGALRNILLEEGYIDEKDVVDESGNLRMRVESKDVYPMGCRVDEDAGMDRVDNGVIKAVLDENLTRFFKHHGFLLNLPPTTRKDLHTTEGRMAYLREIGSRNQDDVRKIGEKMAREIGRQLGIVHGSGGHVGGHIYVHRLGEIHITEDVKKDPKGRSGKRVEIRTGRTGEILEGAPGGGSTRPDNLGYGLRDLNFVNFDPLNEEAGGSMTKLAVVAESCAKLAEEQFPGRGLGDVVKHFHVKLIQQADIDLLFAPSFPPDGEHFPGSFVLLTQVLGGGVELFGHIEKAFRETYDQYYAEARSRYAPEFFRNVDTSPDKPDYVFEGSSEEPRAKEAIKSWLTPPSLAVRSAA